MKRVKCNIRDIIYSMGFLFRPIILVAVSFIFLVLTCVLLVIIILNLDKSTKIYQVLLSILTGATASLTIAIIMELSNNYRFNTKRQRELREYLQQVACYGIDQNSIIKTNAEDEYDSVLGNGRTYAVFCHLNEIIPCLREALNNREYLYKTEIDEIDDILYEYEFSIIKILWIELSYVFPNLVRDDMCTDEIKVKDEGLGEKNNKLKRDESKPNFDDKLIDESIRDYVMLFNFLKKEAVNCYGKEKHVALCKDTSKQLESVIEKAIFLKCYVFNGYFEVTDERYEFSNSKGYKEDQESNLALGKNAGFQFRSNMISKACGNIDRAMIKLQKRIAKEPYFWVTARYKEKN